MPLFGPADQALGVSASEDCYNAVKDKSGGMSFMHWWKAYSLHKDFGWHVED